MTLTLPPLSSSAHHNHHTHRYRRHHPPTTASSTSSTLSPPTSPCSSTPLHHHHQQQRGPRPSPYTLRAITGTEHYPTAPPLTSTSTSTSPTTSSSKRKSLPRPAPPFPLVASDDEVDADAYYGDDGPAGLMTSTLLRPRISSVTDMSATSPDTSRTDCAASDKHVVVSSNNNDRMKKEAAAGNNTTKRQSSATPSVGRTRTKTDGEYIRDGDDDEVDGDDEDDDDDRASTYSHASAVNLDDLDDDDLAGIHVHHASVSASASGSGGSSATNNRQPQRTLGKPRISRQVLDLRRQSFINSLTRAREAKDRKGNKRALVPMDDSTMTPSIGAVIPQQTPDEANSNNKNINGQQPSSLTLMERCVTALTEVLDVNLTHAKMATERFVSFQALYTPDERRVVAEILRETTARLRSERAGGTSGKGGGGGGWRKGTFLGKYLGGANYNGGLYNQYQPGAMVDGGGYLYGYAGLNEQLLQQQLEARASNQYYHAARCPGAYNVNPLHNNQQLLRAVALRQQQFTAPQYVACDESGTLTSSRSSHQLMVHPLGNNTACLHNAVVAVHPHQLTPGTTTAGTCTSSSNTKSSCYSRWISSPTGMYTFSSHDDDIVVRSVIFGMHVIPGIDSTEAMLLRMAGEFQRDEVTRRHLSWHRGAERVDVPLSFAMTLTAALATFSRLECVAGYKRYASRNAANRRTGLPQAVLWLRTKYDGMRLSFGVTLHGESPCTVLFKRPRVFSLRKIDEYAAVVTEAKDILAEFGRDVVAQQQHNGTAGGTTKEWKA